MTKQEMSDRLVNLLIDTTVETVLKNENTQHTEAYKSGLITKIELIENSQLKDLAKHF